MITTIAEKTPILKQIYAYLVGRRFQTNGYGRFWGIYNNFEEARLAAPKTKSVGYDDAQLAHEYERMLEENDWENSGRIIREYDYPILFWLKSIFDRQEGSKIFDFGGNVGVHFYSYARYLQYPQDLQWLVCELPEIAKVGREIADKRGVERLDFTSDVRDMENRDLFLGSGSVQYIENLSQMFAIGCKPKHILINRLPLYSGKQFVTLQNGGLVFYPQYVFNRNEFIKSIESLGYKLVDIWDNQGHSCVIPFHKDKSIYHYYGLYFQLD